MRCLGTREILPSIEGNLVYLSGGLAKDGGNGEHFIIFAPTTPHKIEIIDEFKKIMNLSF